MLLAKKWVDKVYDIQTSVGQNHVDQITCRGGCPHGIVCLCPQTGLEESTKDAFYDSLQTVISELPDKEIVTLAETGMDTLDEKQLDMKVFMEVLGMANVMQMVIES